MNKNREIAIALAGDMFDFVERDRMLVRQRIEEVIFDGLVLHQAKDQRAPLSVASPVAPGSVMDATKRFVKMALDDVGFLGRLPYPIKHALDQLYIELINTGWRP